MILQDFSLTSGKYDKVYFHQIMDKVDPFNVPTQIAPKSPYAKRSAKTMHRDRANPPVESTEDIVGLNPCGGRKLFVKNTDPNAGKAMERVKAKIRDSLWSQDTDRIKGS